MAYGVVRTFQVVITSEWKAHGLQKTKNVDSSKHDTGRWNGKPQLRHFVSGCNVLNRSACLGRTSYVIVSSLFGGALETSRAHPCAWVRMTRVA